MKAILILFLLLSSPSFYLDVPERVIIGNTFLATVEIHNDSNSSLRAIVSLVSPYKDQRTVELAPGESLNISFSIYAERIETINVTVVIIYYIGAYSYSKTLTKFVEVVEAENRIDATSILLGLLIFTIAVSIVGYLAMKRRVEGEEEEISIERFL